MATKIGVNGFGRIGRQVLRAMIERYPDSLEVVAINDLGDTSTNAHMFRYDSNYGIYPGKVDVSEKQICIDGLAISVIQEREPSKIKWGDFGVEIVVESTGFFTDADKASGHLEGGANKVIISPPAKPPSGPKSIIQSEHLITSILCSMTTTVFPLFLSFSRTLNNNCTS